jgi:hypothetical protein
VLYALLIYDADTVEAPYVLADPETATCVRADAVSDGPFAGPADALRALDVIDVETLDEAIEAASQVPGGTIEIRPLEQRA